MSDMLEPQARLAVSDRWATRRMRSIIALGAVLGASGVLAGAFGAHALKRTLEPVQLATWDTAAEYQLAHALLLVIVGVLGLHQLRPSVKNRAHVRTLFTSATCLFAGTLIFSGSLYAWILTDMRAYVMLTPVGGILLVVGWLALMVWALRGLRN